MPENLLIALSGGADSVALLLWSLEHHKAAAAAHCNFHLRGAESDRDEKFVRQLCQDKGVRLFVRHFHTLAEARNASESLETTARRLRYSWFEQLCREHGFEAVAVGHHREDNAETLVLNLVRGSGLRGLGAMKEVQGHVVRPLLDWSRDQILRFLAERNQAFVNDSSNDDLSFRRNFVRHEILPRLQNLNPRIHATLHETAQRLTQSAQIYEFGLKCFHEKFVQPLPDGFRIAYTDLQDLPAATILHEILYPLGFPAKAIPNVLNLREGGLIESNRWCKTSAMELAPDGQSVPHLDERRDIDCAAAPYICTRNSGYIEVRRKPIHIAAFPLDFAHSLQPGTPRNISLPNGQTLRIEALQQSDCPNISKESNVATLDADKLQGQLIIRSLTPGDRFRPFGMKGTRLVSDLLTDRHFSRIDKLASLVLTDSNGILWLIGQRIDQRAAVTQTTSRILQLTYQL